MYKESLPSLLVIISLLKIVGYMLKNLVYSTILWCNYIDKIKFNYDIMSSNKLFDAENQQESLKILDKKEHYQKKGMIKIARIIEKINRKVPSKFLESSETKRQPPKIN